MRPIEPAWNVEYDSTWPLDAYHPAYDYAETGETEVPAPGPEWEYVAARGGRVLWRRPLDLQGLERRLHELWQRDTESAHADADKVLIAALRLLGGEKVDNLIKAYQAIPKWYA